MPSAPNVTNEAFSQGDIIEPVWSTPNLPPILVALFGETSRNSDRVPTNPNQWRTGQGRGEVSGGGALLAE